MTASRPAPGPYRRLVWPGIMTLLMLVVLVGLGTWQVERLRWKSRILAEVALAEASPPNPLPPDPKPFARVQVTGRLRPDPSALYGAEVRTLPSGPEMGARLIAVVERTGGPPILVDRGWVPTRRAGPIDQPGGDQPGGEQPGGDQPGGEVTIDGFVHPGDTASWFSATDDVPGRRFYTLDPQVIGAALGLERTEPFVIVALGPAPAAGWPDPAKHLPRPQNNHLVYALTWYGFAVTLAVIFVIWARKRLRA